MRIDESWPISVSCAGEIAGATVTWRRQGQLYATIVARVTLEVVRGVLKLAAPRPFGADREHMRLSELAPLMPRCDVVMACTPKAPEVRLAVSRGGELLLDKRVSADDARKLVRTGASAPSSRHALDVPEGYDFASLQSAPLDQRTDYLQGGELVVLAGVAFAEEEAELVLPRMRPRLQLVTPSATSTLHCHLDTLAIDADERRVTVLFRGHIPVAEVTLASARADVVLDALSGSALRAEPSLGDLFSTMPLRRDLPPPRKMLNATALPDPQAPLGAPMPFSGSAAAPSTPPLAQDLDLSGGTIAAAELPSGAPMPFEAHDLKGGTIAALDGLPGAVIPFGVSQPPNPRITSKPVAARLDALERAVEKKHSAGKRDAPDAEEARREAEARSLREAEEHAQHEAAEREAAAKERARREEQERAAAEAEQRRSEEAARFAAEQRAAQEREAGRRAEEQAKRVERAKTLKSNLYDFKKHK